MSQHYPSFIANEAMAILCQTIRALFAARG
jgi:hypothetical protein